ncbi:hypothetical protein KAJ89_04680 [Candidatus Parcubacteria bacterium]|nr:hypothetical protein [Candidatus Parcubacteria bacterium]
MNITNLQNMAKSGQLRQESFKKLDIITRMSIVKGRIGSAEFLLKNNNNDEGIDCSAYSELYQSYRIICECLLGIHGYRVSNSQGHHEAAINSIWLTMDDEKNFVIYSRMKNICKRRNDLDYGAGFNISNDELATMLSDVKFVYKKAIILINDHQE